MVSIGPRGSSAGSRFGSQEKAFTGTASVRDSARQGNGLVWQSLLWPGGVVTWFVTGNRPLYALSGALGVVDTDGEVVPLQTQLGAFDEPEFGDALA
jgi:hypothetical protein